MMANVHVLHLTPSDGRAGGPTPCSGSRSLPAASRRRSGACSSGDDP